MALTGILAKCFWRKNAPEQQSFKKLEEGKNLDEEMADVLFSLICLANKTGVDLTEAFLKNMEKKTERDKTRHKENKKLKRLVGESKP